MSWEDAWYYGPSTGKRTRLENEGLDFEASRCARSEL